jgi:hypothetical protein
MHKLHDDHMNDSITAGPTTSTYSEAVTEKSLYQQVADWNHWLFFHHGRGWVLCVFFEEAERVEITQYVH